MTPDAPMRARRRHDGLPGIPEPVTELAAPPPGPGVSPPHTAHQPVAADGPVDDQEPAAPRRRPAALRPAPAGANPYSGARSRHFHFRLLDPSRDRYEDLVRGLEADGVATDVTELLHALMHEGPRNCTEARELLQRWRLVRAQL
jgi:hypothetical protein